MTYRVHRQGGSIRTTRRTLDPLTDGPKPLPSCHFFVTRRRTFWSVWGGRHGTRFRALRR